MGWNTSLTLQVPSEPAWKPKGDTEECIILWCFSEGHARLSFLSQEDPQGPKFGGD